MLAPFAHDSHPITLSYGTATNRDGPLPSLAAGREPSYFLFIAPVLAALRQYLLHQGYYWLPVIGLRQQGITERLTPCPKGQEMSRNPYSYLYSSKIFSFSQARNSYK